MTTSTELNIHVSPEVSISNDLSIGRKKDDKRKSDPFM